MKSQEAISLQRRVQVLDREKMRNALANRDGGLNRHYRLGNKHSLAAIAARDGQPTPRQVPVGITKLAMHCAKQEERANMRLMRRQAIMVRAVVDGPAITPDAGQRDRCLRGYAGKPWAVA